MGSVSDVRVAAIVPVYRATFLAEALASAFAQTRPPDEVVVVADGSPDRDEVARAVAPYGSRVSLIYQPNQGAAAARNRGIAATSADYVALLDADDEWLPDFLRHQLGVLLASPDIDLVYSDGLVVGPAGATGLTFMQSCPSKGNVTLEALLAQRCTVLLSAVVARRKAILDAGSFDLDIRRGQDFDLWLRMARRGSRMSYHRRVLMRRRIHDDNLSGTAVNEQERPLRVLEKTLQTMPLSPRERRVAEKRVRHLNAALAREHGKELLRRGEFAAARREFARARHASFSWKLHVAFLGLHVAPHLVRRIYLMRASSYPSHVTAA